MYFPLTEGFVAHPAGHTYYFGAKGHDPCKLEKAESSYAPHMLTETVATHKDIMVAIQETFDMLICFTPTFRIRTIYISNAGIDTYYMHN